MTEKVKLSREQADAVEALLRVWDGQGSRDNVHKILIKEKIEETGEWERFSELSSALTIGDLDFIDALRIGYEVKEEFKVGDWVVHINKGVMLVISIKEDVITTDYKLGYGVNLNTSSKNFRYATPEEIK